MSQPAHAPKGIPLLSQRLAHPQPTATAASPVPIQQSYLPTTTNAQGIQQILHLQRTMGNRALSHMISERRSPAPTPPTSPIALQAAQPRIQRLAVTENPVNAQKPALKEITELPGGHKGIVFKLTNQGSEQLVVKFQKEAPKEAVVGTEMMKVAGGTTPDLRLATEADLGNLSAGVEMLAESHKTQVEKFMKCKSEFKFTLIMGFASGRTVQKVMNETPLKLISALQNQNFLQSFGRLLAGDAFAGNPDRAFAGQIGDNGGKRGAKDMGWYHEGNIMIDEQENGYSAVAIDNAFAPALWGGMRKTTGAFGRYLEGVGLQFGSVAVANKALFAEEVRLILERMLTELTNRHKTEEVTSKVVALKEKLPELVAVVVQSGQRALRKLLKNNNDWTTKIKSGGGTAKDVEMFDTRRHYMRLVRAGLDPKGEALTIAQDPAKYRKWRKERRASNPKQAAKKSTEGKIEGKLEKESKKILPSKEEEI